MKTKTITIMGKEVGVAYCYATEIAFRKYTGKGVENFDPTNPEHAAYIILAAILAYYQYKGEEAPVTDKDIIYETSPKDIIDAMTAVFKLRGEWYELPEGEPEDKEEEKPKNP